MAKRLDSLREARIEKLEKLRAQGVNPYTAHSKRTHTAIAAKQKEGEKVVLTGRIWGWREHGGSIFADLLDFSGQIQLFFSRDILGEKNYDRLSLVDLGDFLNVEGEVFKTQAGELTVRVESLTLLTKAIRPIPSTWHGIKDPEIRLRKRYLDLMLNPEERDLFVKKSKFWTSTREFLINEDFLEVETPALEAVPGGADATPFITHHEALDQDFYLRISLELYQKRALVGGFEKVFEIGKIFRNEGVDQEHLQDYLQMEFYWAYADYNDLMDLTQKMYQQIVKDTVGSLKTIYRGNEIDWGGKWPRVDYTDAFKEATGLDLDHVSEDELRQYAKENRVPVEVKIGRGRLIDSIYKRTVRPNLIQPTFLINHPVDVSPLAKRMEENPNKVERMQILIGGTEVGNGFSELNDPVDQYNRFKDQQKLLEAGDTEAQRLDVDYVEALEYGMPPAAGFGFSQRLFAVVADRPIRETVMFPPMKQE